MATTPARDPQRYGTPIVSARTARTLTVIAALTFLAVVAVIGVQVANQPVRATVQSYEHISNDRIAVTFSVQMRPGTAARCTVQAVNDGAAQVGFVEVPIPPQGESVSSHRVEIATQGDAVSADVLACEKQ